MCVLYLPIAIRLVGFPGGSVVKNPPANAGDTGDVGLIPGSGKSPGEENGNRLRYSCLDNPVDNGAWWATVHGIAKSEMRLFAKSEMHMHPIRSGK